MAVSQNLITLIKSSYTKISGRCIHYFWGYCKDRQTDREVNAPKNITFWCYSRMYTGNPLAIRKTLISLCFVYFSSKPVSSNIHYFNINLLKYSTTTNILQYFVILYRYIRCFVLKRLKKHIAVHYFSEIWSTTFLVLLHLRVLLFGEIKCYKSPIRN